MQIMTSLYTGGDTTTVINSRVSEATVTSEDEGTDVTLEAHIQFITANSAATLDFSNYIWVVDEEDRKDAVKEILSEMEAVNTLLNEVTKFHAAFISQSNQALAALQ